VQVLDTNSTNSCFREDDMAKKKKRSPVSIKIGKLMNEGKDQREAAGEAYGMEREGRLTKRGGYRRAGRKKRK
jgi:hypothetical protein